MANGGPNDNGSQFFFTLGRADELNQKNTIFGKVSICYQTFALHIYIMWYMYTCACITINVCMYVCMYVHVCMYVCSMYVCI